MVKHGGLSDDALLGLPLFADTPPADVRELRRLSEGMAFRPGQVVFEQGEAMKAEALLLIGGRLRVSVESGGVVTSPPSGSLPVAVAVLTTCPAVTSAAVITYSASAVQVVEVPGASVVTGQVTEPTLGSLTVMPLIGTSPLLVTTNVNWIVSPASTRPSWFTSTGVPACLSSSNDG